MKAGILIGLAAAFFSTSAMAQDRCASSSYQQTELAKNPFLAQSITAAETIVRQQLNSHATGRIESTLIKIPVVVHILYHTQEEKITDAQVMSQITALNKYFRRLNSDTTTTPAYFRSLAADCEIEFQLAISDSRKRSTSGITRKYTPISKWGADDKMKFNSEMGTDAWDAKSYLNIWVCNLDKFAGYASFPGGDLSKDGVVISYKAFGTTGTATGGYNMGKTAVHEVGHWLGIKHTWGDANCGDDEVGDTPQQASYTIGCPNTVRITCGNGPYGDMYMNYMDLTNDACTNMFTIGQKNRMQALFSFGAFRNAMLQSTGLNPPLVSTIPLPEEADPKWLEPKLYPNPASSTVSLDLNYDSRWIGQTIFVTNLSGQSVMNVIVNSKNMQININHLQAGIYFLAAKKPDGESMRLKFVKL